MSATLPSPKSPVGLLLIGGAALWLLTRRSSAQSVPGVSANTQQTYYTPTGVAELLAKAVVGLTKNIATPAAVGANATPQAPSFVKADSASQGAFGWNYGDAGSSIFTLGSPLGGWTMPRDSYVGVPSSSGGFVDASVAAPVYSITDDFVNNPFQYAAP